MPSIRAPQIDMTRTIARFAVAGGVVLKQRNTAARERVAGRWYEPPPVSTTIQASVQPATPEDAQALPEGVRASTAQVVYSTSEVRPQGRLAANLGDILSWGGHDYECVSVEDWNTNGRYWRAVCVRLAQ